jgi:siroheme synthase (precorrin-2 oxidase/ferrochelatase)
MAVIPPDAGIRMRLQNDAGPVQPLQAVKAIAAELPDLQPGQVFTARILEALPDTTYRALVAGKQLTLQLPEGATAGDTLDLAVVDRTPKTLIARRADATGTAGTAGTTSAAYPYMKISTAGRLIGELMLPESETPQAAALNRGQPLVAQAPTSATELAPALAKAVSQSGLFYESHQAQWLTGQRELAALRAEPQGRLPAPPRPAASMAVLAQLTGAGAASATSPGNMLYNVAGQVAQVQQTFNAATTGHSGDTQAAPSTASLSPAQAQTIPDEIRPLVQQQLDAVASQRLAWHGEAWPGQGIDWQIERDVAEEHNTAPGGEGASRWSTRLRLTMPRLGAVDATLQLAGNRLRLHITTDSEATAADLRRQVPALERRLADAGLGLQIFEAHGEA